MTMFPTIMRSGVDRNIDTDVANLEIARSEMD